MMRFVFAALALINLGIYLFVTAPAPLPDASMDTERIPIEDVLGILNAENTEARRIYTRDIVGAGVKVGLRFDEDWQERDVQAGPLPALFLRETARRLERRPQRLGLFLGSAYPIRAANKFSGEQAEAFSQLVLRDRPSFFRSEDTGRHTAMFADLAVADACVSCHNDHPSSPKRDWARGDVMGATTWTYPESDVSVSEALALVDALRGSLADAYAGYLAKAAAFDPAPEIGDRWPADVLIPCSDNQACAQRPALPSTEVFMAKVRAAAAQQTLDALLAARRTKDGARTARGQP